MASRFLPVELKTIEEGRFLSDCEREFAKLQDALIKHARKYTGESARKATLSMKVEVIEKNDQYGIVTDVKIQLPGRPQGKTAAMAEENESGVGFSLFSQSSGTNKNNPNQKTFSTEDGRGLDPETGLPKEDY